MLLKNLIRYDVHEDIYGEPVEEISTTGKWVKFDDIEEKVRLLFVPKEIKNRNRTNNNGNTKNSA